MRSDAQVPDYSTMEEASLAAAREILRAETQKVSVNAIETDVMPGPGMARPKASLGRNLGNLDAWLINRSFDKFKQISRANLPAPPTETGTPVDT